MENSQQAQQDIKKYLASNTTGYFHKNKFNSYESIAVSYHDFVEKNDSQAEHMLCYPISDLGVVNKDDPAFKVFLSEKAGKTAQSIKQKTKFAVPNETTFILDRVSKDENGDIETGWVNQPSRDHASTVLSGIAFIREPEKKINSDGEIVDVLVNRGGEWVPKNKMSILTAFPQFSACLKHPDQLKPVMKQIIDQSGKSVPTGITSVAIRVFVENSDEALFLEFNGKKDSNENYRALSWEELKEIPEMQKRFNFIYDSVVRFMKQAEDEDKVVILEVMPALLHYPGPYTSKNKHSLSNPTNYNNYFLSTGNTIKDEDGNELPEIISGGRQSYVGIELNTHSVTKVLPVNFNSKTNEFAFNQDSPKGKTPSQLKNNEGASPDQAPGM